MRQARPRAACRRNRCSQSNPCRWRACCRPTRRGCLRRRPRSAGTGRVARCRSRAGRRCRPVHRSACSPRPAAAWPVPRPPVALGLDYGRELSTYIGQSGLACVEGAVDAQLLFVHLVADQQLLALGRVHLGEYLVELLEARSRSSMRRRSWSASSAARVARLRKSSTFAASRIICRNSSCRRPCRGRRGGLRTTVGDIGSRAARPPVRREGRSC